MSQISDNERAELERLRKVVVPAHQIAFDMENGLALVIARKSKEGIHLMTPVVIAVPVADVFTFTAVTIQRMSPVWFGAPNQVRPT